MLRDAALAWVKSHISLPPLQHEFMGHFDEAARTCTPCSLLFGRELGRNRKPYLVHCFAREFFVFQLTEAQAAMAELLPNESRYQTSARPNRLGLAADLPVTLLRFEIERAEALPWNRPISVDVAYDARPISSNAPNRVSVRMDYDLPNGTSVTASDNLFHLPGGKGRIRCSFTPLAKDPEPQPPPGPMAVFLSFTPPPSPGVDDEGRQLSNVRGALVSIAR